MALVPLNYNHLVLFWFHKAATCVVLKAKGYQLLHILKDGLTCCDILNLSVDSYSLREELGLARRNCEALCTFKTNKPLCPRSVNFSLALDGRALSE